MKKLLKEFFFLKRGERSALLVFTGLLICATAFRIWIGSRPEAEFFPDPEFLEEMIALQHSLKDLEKDTQEKQSFNAGRNNTKKPLLPFDFDPNSVTKANLEQMNIPDFIADNLMKYRNAGGKFYNANDLRKIYGMQDSIFNALHPFIEIAKDSTKLEAREEYIRKDKLPVFELNAIDSVKLMLLPGIGPSFSRRILKYRDLLGGFYQLDQLWEVYGMDSLRFTSVQNNCRIDTSLLQRIDLNECSFKDLISHPYIDKPGTYSILQYRDFVTSIKSLDELETNQILDHDSFNKVRPYLSVNNEKDK